MRKHPDAKCENCDWREQSGFADASGPTDSRFLVVGEAPGRVEVDTGEPFTGPSGILLDKVLAHHGINRDEIRFTNVVACHPPYGPGKGSVTPPQSVINCCAPRLRQEAEGREKILCLGNTAKAAITGNNSSMAKARVGPPKEFNGTKVVSTYHPAACLRSGDFFPSMVKDIGKLAHDSLFTGWEPPVHKVFDTQEEAWQALDELIRGNYPFLVIDIETGVEKDTSFTHPKDWLCVGIGYAPNKVAIIGEQALKHEIIRRRLRTLFEKNNIVCHNGKYDLQVMMRLGVLQEPGLYADTMLASYALDERPGYHGLKGLATERLGAPDYEDEIKQYLGTSQVTYAVIPRPILYKYCAYDVACTYNLKTDLDTDLERQGMKRVHDMLVGFSNELTYVELDGFKIDLEYLDVLTIEYVKEIQQLDKTLKQWVENPRSPQQVMKAIQELGYRAHSTNVEVLTNLYVSTGHEFFRLMLESRKANKLYGTYVKGLRKRLIDDRTFPTYLIHGTVFGRLAARNPNIHNQPRGDKIRKLFIPEEGNVLVACDYSQAELRVIACEAQDDYLRGVFTDPTRDIHGEVSDTLYGVGNWGKEERVRAKAYVFGSAYGREAGSIANEFKVPLAEAQRGQDEFFKMIPDTVAWRKSVHERVFKGGQALQTHFGRKRRFHLITRDNKMDVMKESLAFIPQSTAADICLLSLCEIRKHFGYSKHSPKVRTTIHDSVIVECAKDEAHEVGKEMSSIMERVAREQYSDFVPFVAEPEIGKSWGELEAE